MYIHNKLKFKLRPDLHISGSEDIFIEIINSKSKNIIVGTIYRPPNSEIDLFLHDIDEGLHKILQENKNVYLMGDYNIDLLTTTQHNNLRFINILQSNAFYPHINKPTRISNTSQTLIDNIFSNVYFNSTNGILYSDISDHLPIFVVCNQENELKSMQNNINYHRKETQANIDSLNIELAQEEWQDVYDENEVNKSYDNFINKLLFYYNKHIPLIPNTTRKNERKMPWITKGILHSIHARNRLYKIFLRHPTVLNKENYKRYRNLLTTLIRLSRKLYYSSKLDSNNGNLSKVWQTISELIKSKKKCYPDTLIKNGNEIKDPKEISNMFNEYFTNIGPKLASTVSTNSGHFTQYLSNKTDKSLFFKPTNSNEIIDIVKSLKPSRSCGYDEISVALLKKIIFYISSPLTHIVNLSFISGVFPNSLKIAKIVPIFKKDDPAQVENYRPISLLPAISKILEKIAYIRLYKFLNENNLLNSNQFGFRSGYSTDYAIIQSCDKIINTLAKKEHIIGIFLDLSKAFDTIDHHILIYKLSTYGIRGIILSWFKIIYQIENSL